MPPDRKAADETRNPTASALTAPAAGAAPSPANDILIDQHGYESLAGFRHHVRRFFAFSEQTVSAAGLSTAQYQAMLAIRAHASDHRISLTELADQLLIRINSAVELVARLVDAGLVERIRAQDDRRRVELTLTTLGTTVLAGLATLHFEQHRKQLPDLLAVISGLSGF